MSQIVDGRLAFLIIIMVLFLILPVCASTVDCSQNNALDNGDNCNWPVSWTGTRCCCWCSDPTGGHSWGHIMDIGKTVSDKDVYFEIRPGAGDANCVGPGFMYYSPDGSIWNLFWSSPLLAGWTTYSGTVHIPDNFRYIRANTENCPVDWSTVVLDTTDIPLIAHFTANVTSGTAPLAVQFYDNSTGSPIAWNWAFGDGSSSIQQNPVHTYAFSGTFSVSLNATNAGGSNVSVHTNSIVVNVPKPIPDFTANVFSGTAPLPVLFTDLSLNNPTGWAWYFGDEDYTAPWTQQTAGAGWSTRWGHSSVAMPEGSIVLMGGYDGGDKNDVWRSTDNGLTWTQQTAGAGWSTRWGHSSVVMPDSSIVLMGGYGGGDYKNDVWRSTDNGASWILQTAGAGWTGRVRHSSVALPDGSIVLTGGDVSRDIFINDTWRSTDNGATWTRMNASAGWTARSQHSSVVMPDGSIVLMGGYIGAGNKNDVWRSTDNGAMWTKVNASAAWTARRYHSSVAMLDGSIVLMGGYGGSNKNDVWRFMPAGSSAQNPSHTYTTPGIYPVALQAYNTGGYNSTRKTGYITVMVLSTPVADFMTNVTSGTAPLTVRFYDNSTGSSIAWNWSFGDGSWFNITDSALHNAFHTYTASGIYTVSLTVCNAKRCDTELKANYITVNPVAQQADHSIILQPGWNFISTPKTLESGNNTALIFKDVSTESHTIWLYDASGRRWTPMSAGTKVRPLDGIWIYAASRTDVPLQFTRNPIQAPPTTLLFQGWNAIGFSDIIPASARATLLSVKNDWASLMGYDAENQQYEVSIINGEDGSHSDATSMIPTKGYWLFMTGDGEVASISS